MNKRSYLLEEARRWMEEGIITEEQLTRIASRYPERDQGSSLPVFAGILFGLGVLTFVASNWDGFTHGVRMLIIVLSLIAAYGLGELFRQRGYEKIGMACTFIGVALYGAGFFLIGQMYHLSANPVNAFYLWFVGAAAIAWHYKSHLLAASSLAILLVSGIYGAFTDSRDILSAIYFYLLFFAGVLPFVWKFRTKMLAALAAVTLLIASTIDNVMRFESLMFAQVIVLLMLFVASVLKQTAKEIANVVQIISYVALTLFSALMIFFPQEFMEQVTGRNTLFFVINVLVLAGFAVFLRRNKQLYRLTDLVPFLPLSALYLYQLAAQNIVNANFIHLDVYLILSLFVFAVGMVLGGERHRDIFRINLGALMFAVTCAFGYINYAWDFMDKSAFFLVGGALLLALSFFLERQRRKWVKEAKGADLE